MILDADMVKLVRERRKSQARMPVLYVSDDRALPCRYVAGRMYGVAPPGQRRADIYVTVLDTAQQRLGDVSQLDARREGFRFLREFQTRWELAHGRFDPERLVWVVAFSPGDWREHFDRPRLLKATPGVHGEDVEEHQDYTERPDLALFGEPEALTESQLKPYVREANQRDDVRRRAGRAEVPRAQRLAELESRARAGDREAQRSLYVIDQRIQRSERRAPREVTA